MQHRWPVLFVLGIVLALCALGGYKAYSIKKAIAMGGGGGPPPSAVVVVPVASTDFEPRAQMVGTVAAKQTVSIRPELAGLVTKVNFDSGARVKQGDELLRLDTSVEEADLKAARARVALAQATLNRVTQAVSMGATTPTDVDTAQAELDSAQAGAQRLEVLIAKKTIRAPFDAVLGIRTIHPGQYVREGDDVAMLESATEDAFVDFAVPQELVSRLSVGTTVRILTREVPTGRTLEGVVTAQQSAASAATRTVIVRALVKGNTVGLSPGMSVAVDFARADVMNTVKVPVMAIRRASYGDHVFIIEQGKDKDGKPLEDKDGKPVMVAKQRYVTLGEEVAGGVIVLQGLKPGEQIAADGSFKLYEGATVVPMPPEMSPSK
jgi:membrane fusion protein (multidrug efflux system)